MKTLTIYKRILSVLIIICLSMVFSPRETRAQITVTDFGNLVQNTISTVSTVFSEGLSYSDNYKEYVLDPLASGFAKMIIKNITGSIVNWINSGFHGSPSFVTDPGSFFLDIADQATGQFISKSGVLSALCTNFNLDIQLALRFKYHPNIAERYTCTLGTIIKNGKNAVANASINGFTAGDFRQGGWPAFISLTSEPQNNIYGAYLQAESDLSWKILSAQAQQQKELDQGKGFLSWRTCKKVKVDSNFLANAEVVASEDPTDPRLAAYYEGNDYYDKCEVQTPGSTISSALETQLGSPVRQLELADEFGEIVNALFAQLVVKTLQGGLSSLSKPDASGTSYLRQVSNSVNNNNATLKNVREQILAKIDGYIKRAEEYNDNKQKSLAVVLVVKNNYDNAKLCYVTKIASNNPPLSDLQRSTAESKISEIDNEISLNVAPIATPIISSASTASTSLQTLRDIKDGVDIATTFEEIQPLSDSYTYLIQSGGLPDSRDIGLSQQEIVQTRERMSDLKVKSEQRLQECQSFP